MCYKSQSRVLKLFIAIFNISIKPTSEEVRIMLLLVCYGLKTFRYAVTPQKKPNKKPFKEQTNKQIENKTTAKM